MTRFALFLALFTASALAEPDCPAPQLPTVNSEVADVAQVIVDVNGNNNQCPMRPYQDHFESVTTIDELRNQVNSRLSAMGLTAEWEAGREGPSRWSAFENTPADLVRAKRLANVTIAAMSQYPAGFFRRAGLGRIRMIKDLRVSYRGTDQVRMAVPDPRSDMLYFAENDQPGLTGCLEEIEMRMHHELFHLMEGTFHRNNMYPNISSWNRLNPEGFEYRAGGGESYANDAAFADRERPQDGFATGYATFGAEEDRSEVFAYMMTRGFSERQRGWASVDPILNRKIQHIEGFLRERLEVGPEFFNRSSTPQTAPSSP